MRDVTSELKALRLHGMAGAWTDLMAQGTTSTQSSKWLIEHLLQAETTVTANTWPPEVDFNETFGGTADTTATVHYGASNSQIQRTVKLDMTQWHTWGVIWTAATITYTVDGNVWGTVTTSSSIPNQAMWLTLQQQTWCASGWACPTAPQSMQVDWVAEYTAN